MNAPGKYALIFAGSGDCSITTAGTTVGDWLTGLDGMLALTAQLTFAYGTGGTDVRAYLQTSLDGGTTAIDIACVKFALAGETVVLNFSAATPRTAQLTPTDSGLADDSAVDGVLGDRIRLKVVSTGTYANTVLAGRVVVR
jgi:hypothetical protein